MPKKKARLIDVAQRANVSTATASMALSGGDRFQGRLSEETKQRILEIAREMNYHPAAFAKQMKGQASQIIGLIIPDLMNQFYPEVACGFSNTANKFGYNVILLNSENKIERERSFIETLLEMRVEGVAICGANLTNEKDREKQRKIYRKLQQAEIPVLMVDRYDDSNIFPYVGIDNREAAFTMTEMLILDGHKKIAAVSAREDVYILNKRKQGYMEAMEKYNLEPVIFETDQGDLKDVRDKSRRIMQDERGFTALFNISNDIGAAEAIRSANELGLRIPDDISIAGFDDISLSSLLNPSLTTISQPKYEMGETAMKVLVRMISERDIKADNVILPFQYVKRNSTRQLL